MTEETKDEKKKAKPNRLELAIKELQEQIVKLGKGFGRAIKLEHLLTIKEEK